MSHHVTSVKVLAGSPALQPTLSTLVLSPSPLGFYGPSASVFWCQGYVLHHRKHFWVSLDCCSLRGCVCVVSWQQYSSTVLPGAKALKVPSNLKVCNVCLRELISRGWWEQLLSKAFRLSSISVVMLFFATPQNLPNFPGSWC